MMQKLKNLCVLGGMFCFFEIFFRYIGRGIMFFDVLSNITSLIFIFLSVFILFDYPLRFITEIQKKYPKLTIYLTHIGWGPYVLIIISICFEIFVSYDGENLSPEFAARLSAKILKIYYFIIAVMVGLASYKILKLHKGK